LKDLKTALGDNAEAVSRVLDNLLKPGDDCTIITYGSLVDEALRAAKLLQQEDLNCTVIDSHTIRPLDKHTIINSAKTTGCVVTAEEHHVNGGLGSAVASLVGQYAPVPLRILGVTDIVKPGTADEQRQTHKLTAQHIANAAKDVIMQRCRESCFDVPQLMGEPEKLNLEHEFKLYGGGTIHTLPGLQEALLDMSDIAFSHHCNNHRNDFSSWVKDVFNEPHLAKQLEQKKTRLAMASTISHWLT